MSDREHKDLQHVRREYTRDQLNDSGLPSDPMILFQTWMDEAARSDMRDPTAMTLSTVDESGSPSSRVVLLKKIHEGKLVFFSNKLSTYSDYERDLAFARDKEIFKGLPEEPEAKSSTTASFDRKEYT